MTKFKNMKWLFFDLGSTLINEEKAQEIRIRESVKLLVEQGISMTEQQFFQEMCNASKRYEPQYLAVMENLGSDKIVSYPHQLEQLYAETLPLLDKLRQRYKIGIIANQSLTGADLLKKWQLQDKIDFMNSSADFGIAKPNLEIFKTALEFCDCEPENICMIGDRLDNDIFPAKQLGMKTIWVKQGFGAYQIPISRAYEPDLEVESLKELFDL
ncbi:HAD family hydrolase [Lactococcus allomyrinae]|uniref:HAD family hydrolase n=1 Tax=Lactococcus allomyrinae TaxID=2419773 RepID=A0A387BER8_9LACT|nr:HAD family hydrolase [Lactococcus allomyrinae]AYG00079.1 HAD family hydrolase [Lactococcus allomyrinae]